VENIAAASAAIAITALVYFFIGHLLALSQLKGRATARTLVRGGVSSSFAKSPQKEVLWPYPIDTPTVLTLIPTGDIVSANVQQ
jgi:hypothetical protein